MAEEQGDLFKRKRWSADTAEWRLGAYLDWQAIKSVDTCGSCGGTGHPGRGFGHFDDGDVCSRCGGSGSVHVYPKEAKPKDFPKGLIEHLNKAWIEFFSEPNNV
jgi:hypothetical protein